MYYMEDILERIINLALDMDVEYADVRYQRFSSNLIIADNGKISFYESNTLQGIGLRVFKYGGWGFSSTTDFDSDSIKRMVKNAVSISEAVGSSAKRKRSEIVDVKTVHAKEKVSVKVDPMDIPPEEKIELILTANKNAMISEHIKNSYSRLGDFRDTRLFMNSEGSKIEVDVTMVGFMQMSVAKKNGELERVYSNKSYTKGFEFFKEIDASDFAIKISELALSAVNAQHAKPGEYPVVLDPKIIGLFVHEAMGHATEGDLISNNESILTNKLNKQIGSELVTIVDDGRIKGGYFVPYDDEGVKKVRTVTVENGILKAFLTSRETAYLLEMSPSGNGRAQNYENLPIVRQTNYFIEPRDFSFEELIEDIKEGYYIKGEGAGGGQVDVGQGTFTFQTGPSYIIRNGELGEMVRGTIISGDILSTLKSIDGVGKDFHISTSIFGGCGKQGQSVKVGDGGPHVRVSKMVIGGR